MSLVSIQRSPTPTTITEEQDGGELDEDDSSTTRKSSNNHQKSVSECFITVKGTAINLNHRVIKASHASNVPNASTEEIKEDLETMLELLRPEDSIQIAIRLESIVSKRKRYLVIVTTNGRQGYWESMLIGIDYNEDPAVCPTIGFFMGIMNTTKCNLIGDGSVMVADKNSLSAEMRYTFKPISVQGLWSLYQALNKEIEQADNHNYNTNGLNHNWIGHYRHKIKSTPAQVTEWTTSPTNEWDDQLQQTNIDRIRPISPEQERLRQRIRASLKEIMLSVNLDEVNSRYIREELNKALNQDLSEEKSFVDLEMLAILGQMDKPSRIFDYLYLGTEWNASNYEELKENGVKFVLNVTKEVDNFFNRGDFEYMKISVRDEESSDLLPYWKDTYQFIKKAKLNGDSVLVHCKKGISRSSSTVIAYAMKEYGMSLEDALLHVKEKRNQITPNRGFMTQLKTYEGILYASRNRKSFIQNESSSNPSPIVPNQSGKDEQKLETDELLEPPTGVTNCCDMDGSGSGCVVVEGLSSHEIELFPYLSLDINDPNVAPPDDLKNSNQPVPDEQSQQYFANVRPNLKKGVVAKVMNDSTADYTLVQLQKWAFRSQHSANNNNSSSSGISSTSSESSSPTSLSDSEMDQVGNLTTLPNRQDIGKCNHQHKVKCERRNSKSSNDSAMGGDEHQQQQHQQKRLSISKKPVGTTTTTAATTDRAVEVGSKPPQQQPQPHMSLTQRVLAKLTNKSTTGGGSSSSPSSSKREVSKKSAAVTASNEQSAAASATTSAKVRERRGNVVKEKQEALERLVSGVAASGSGGVGSPSVPNNNINTSSASSPTTTTIKTPPILLSSNNKDSSPPVNNNKKDDDPSVKNNNKNTNKNNNLLLRHHHHHHHHHHKNNNNNNNKQHHHINIINHSQESPTTKTTSSITTTTSSLTSSSSSSIVVSKIVKKFNGEQQTEEEPTNIQNDEKQDADQSRLTTFQQQQQQAMINTENEKDDVKTTTSTPKSPKQSIRVNETSHTPDRVDDQLSPAKNSNCSDDNTSNKKKIGFKSSLSSAKLPSTSTRSYTLTIGDGQRDKTTKPKRGQFHRSGSLNAGSSSSASSKVVTGYSPTSSNSFTVAGTGEGGKEGNPSLVGSIICRAMSLNAFPGLYDTGNNPQ